MALQLDLELVHFVVDPLVWRIWGYQPLQSGSRCRPRLVWLGLVLRQGEPELLAEGEPTLFASSFPHPALSTLNDGP